jgi:iron complex outermembrane receptor protein
MIRALAIVIALAGVAMADDRVPPRARMLADRARVLHDRRDYATAILLFKEAYAIAPSPGLLFNLAQAYRLHGDCEQANDMYRRFLATDPDAEARQVAEMQLSAGRCQPRMVSVVVPHPPSTASPAPAPAPPPEQPPASTLERDIGIGIAIGGAVAIGAAAYYAERAHDASDAVANAFAAGGRHTDLGATDSRGREASRNATMLGIGGGLALASGIALYLLGERAERATVVPTAHGAEVSMAWKF